MESQLDLDARSDPGSDDASESFVITEDLDRTPSILHSFMTQSQYAQVVFQDIADRYPNNLDLLCIYTTTGDLESEENDRIGLYRVPSFAPHDYVGFKWITPDMLVDKKKKTYNIVFDSSSLPKDEDFYQFQYLRGDQVFGASVPFQLRGGESLCTVENDEFTLIDRENDVAHRSLIDKLGSLASENDSLKDQVKELESKLSEVESTCEKLNEDLSIRAESFIHIQEKLKSLEGTSTQEMEQMKTDFAFALQDKLMLEERCHKGQKAIKALQAERDTLAGQVQQQQREKLLLEEEMVAMGNRSEADKNMLLALAKAKELAMQEIKANILRNDELKKRLDRADIELVGWRNQSEAMKAALEDLKVDYEELYNSKENLESQLKQKNYIIQDLELKLDFVASEKNKEIEELQKEISLKQREFEILSHELVNKSKSKFQQIDSLKKQLSEAERSLHKYMNSSTPSNSESTSALQSLSQVEMVAIDMTDVEMSDDRTLQTLGNRIQTLQSDFEKVKRDHAEEIRCIKEELESIRTTGMTVSVNSSLSSIDSRHLLDSSVIQNGIEMAAQQQRASIEEAQPPTAALPPPPLPPRQEATGAPILTPEVAPTAPPLPPPIPARRESKGIPSSDGDNERNRSSFFSSIWPLETVIAQISGTSQGQQAQTTQAIERFDDEEANCSDDDITALANWARGCFMQKQSTDQATGNAEDETQNSESGPTSTVSASSEPALAISRSASGIVGSTGDTEVLLTDDGRTMVAPKPKDSLHCPFCNKEYELNAVERLELHVETHMDKQLNCPVCDQIFELTDESRGEYQRHVQGHFPDDDEGTFQSWFMSMS